MGSGDWGFVRASAAAFLRVGWRCWPFVFLSRLKPLLQGQRARFFCRSGFSRDRKMKRSRCQPHGNRDIDATTNPESRIPNPGLCRSGFTRELRHASAAGRRPLRRGADLPAMLGTAAPWFPASRLKSLPQWRPAPSPRRPAALLVGTTSVATQDAIERAWLQAPAGPSIRCAPR